MKKITIQVEENGSPEITMYEVLRQIENGNTSGVYPHWEITEETEPCKNKDGNGKPCWDCESTLGTPCGSTTDNE